MSFFNENNINDDVELPTWTSSFPTDEVIRSREELMDWAQKRARSHGFVLVKQRTKKYANGFVYKVTLMCDRGGKYKVVDSSKFSATKKCDYKFQLVGNYSIVHDYWTLRVVCDKHNHPPAQHMEGHPFAKRLSDNEIGMVKELTSRNVTPQEILLALKEQNENNVSTIKTIYNARYKFRMLEKVGKTPMQVLMSLLHYNNFVYEFTTNDSNELDNLFFVHPTSFEIWRAFPHVLIIDATYKTNKYNMPFIQIVGVTSTSKKFCIAFAFMNKEKEANYSWVLNCLKSTLEECMQPRVIVTDRELALVNACGGVFPNAARLLCRWHIGQNIKDNCRQTFKSLREWKSFRAMWKLLINSPTWTSYADNYKKLQSILNKYPRVLKYLDQVWLDKYKERFVSVWIDQHLTFGNRTTNRVESQHAKLKKHLKCANSTLDKFVGCIDNIVKLQVTAIRETFEKSRICRYHDHNLPCFQLLRGFVSIEALNLMFRELQQSKGLQFNSSNCGCQLRTSCGLPCACVLFNYLNSGQCIPLDSIDIFWRKLDISQSTFEETDDICCDEEVEMLRENFVKQPKVVKRSVLRKLKDLVNRITTDIKEPAIIRNTRGRPSLKKKQQEKRADPKSQDPRRHSSYGIDLNKKPMYDNYDDTHLNEEPRRHSSYDVDMKPTQHSFYEEPMQFYQEPMQHGFYQQPTQHSFSHELTQHSFYHEPTQHSYSQEPTQHSFYHEPTQHSFYQDPTRDSSYHDHAQHSYYQEPDQRTGYSFQYILPSLFHPYITEVQDVDSDGNCGFRAIAVCLGYSQNDWDIVRRI